MTKATRDNKKYTLDELKYIKENINKIDDAEMGVYLNRKPRAIRNTAYAYGFCSTKKNTTKTKFKEQEKLQNKPVLTTVAKDKQAALESINEKQIAIYKEAIEKNINHISNDSLYLQEKLAKNNAKIDILLTAYISNDMLTLYNALSNKD